MPYGNYKRHPKFPGSPFFERFAAVSLSKRFIWAHGKSTLHIIGNCLYPFDRSDLELFHTEDKV